MHLCADGEPLLVEVQLVVVERGEKPVLHVVWRDISERKRLEEELRRAHRLEAVGRLAGGVAHDFNNLLMAIFGHAYLLEEEMVSGNPDPVHVSAIRHAADRAAALTRQLLTFSCGRPTQSRPIDLGALVDQLGSLLRRLIGDHIHLDVRSQPGSLIVVADPSQLEQVVVNLAINARDAMPGGGTLDIGVTSRHVTSEQPHGELPPGTYVRLSITDSGSGMSPEQIEHAFDPFFTTKPVGKGTGLGLTMVHGIAEQMGGGVAIESTLGQGTSVEVLLPLSDQAAPAPPVEESELDPIRGAGEVILLVDDDEAIRKLYHEVLAAKGFEVLVARDGLDALDRVAECEGRIDLLITDVVMPRMSGPALAQQLSERGLRIRVLFMSGYSDEGDLNLMSEQERTAVLAKPLAPKQLLTEVCRELGQAPCTKREEGQSGPVRGDGRPRTAPSM